MFNIFNIENDFIFSITDYALNTPISILAQSGYYLSCAEIDNIVDFFPTGGIRQEWIIEQDQNNIDIFYIKSAFERYNHTQYLGSPNKNNQVFLYTSKNNFTKWSIKHIYKDQYLIKYVGDKFDKSHIELVVARYNENVDWTMAYNDIVTLYNKGIGKLCALDTIVQLPNFGREGHTYLYHIIQSYDCLNDRTIFSQGDPFEHNKTFLFGIDNCIKTANVQPLGLKWKELENIPTSEYIEEYKTITDYGLVYLRAKCDGNLIISKFDDEGINILNVNANKDYPEYRDINLALGFLHRAKFPSITSLSRQNYGHTKSLDEIFFTYSALFSVVRVNIRKFKKDVYENLMTELLSMNDQGGTNGYVLERLWLYIFE